MERERASERESERNGRESGCMCEEGGFVFLLFHLCGTSTRLTRHVNIYGTHSIKKNILYEVPI